MLRQMTAIIGREGEDYVALCPELDIASQVRACPKLAPISRKRSSSFTRRLPPTRFSVGFTMQSM